MAATVSYKDEKGQTVTIDTYTLISGGSSSQTWEAGTYVVGADYNGDGVINAVDATLGTNAFTITGGAIVSGEVKLILVDGFSLTVTATGKTAGINVHNDDLANPTNQFFVYGQSAGTGALTASNNSGGAGIGGNQGQSGSHITIAGGSVTATGYYGAGIGGGLNASGSNITIYGGSVTAASTGDATYGGAGIGGGNGGSGSTIKIYGGSVTATGSAWGAGIGGGKSGSGSGITISGGSTTATGGTNGAGIGGGHGGSGSDITISGGTVIATGTNGAGIGGGSSGTGSVIKIKGGDVTASSTANGAGIGGGRYQAGTNIEISGGTVTATGSKGAGIGGGEMQYVQSIPVSSDINVAGGTVTANSTYGSGIGGGFCGTTASSNVTVNTELQLKAGAAQAAATEIAHTTGVDVSASLNGQKYATIKPGASVSYVDENGDTQTVTYGSYTLISGGSSSQTWEAGTYVVGADYNGDGVIDAADATVAGKQTAFTITGGAIVSGEVNLILVDGFSLTVTATGKTAGINVHNDDLANPVNQFFVYGQSAGTGALTASNNSGGAGIGGNQGQSGSHITIAGGSVTATGYYGAGIGGGLNASGSNITIYGGTVTAASTGDATYGGAGIGGGNGGSGSTIKIYGGSVTATGSAWGAGIGGGKSGSGSGITISGGSTTATGGTNGAGIGGGHGGSGSDITISGGTVIATGTNGAGIGGGSSGTGSVIKIKGGDVTASSTANGAGIGGGRYQAGTNIEISGGTVTATGSKGAGIGGGEMQYVQSIPVSSDINVAGGTVTANSTYGSGIGGGFCGTTAAENVTVNTKLQLKAGAAQAAATEIAHTTGVDVSASLNGQKYATIKPGASVSYVDEKGDTQTVTYGSYTLVTDSASAVTWTEGTYVVGADYNGDGVINAVDATLGTNAFTISGGAIVSGEVKLILVDGFSLTVTAAATVAGINVHNDDLANPVNQFFVYGQTAGTGALTASNNSGGAGIGGNQGQSGSHITIVGGSVTATGYYGAGIGGGLNASGSNITIYGGSVTAASTGDATYGGAGIGGGNGGSGSTIKIYGGSVTATGSAWGAGIGGGKSGSGSGITISGGSTTATGGTNGAGIGGGHGGTGSGITISGGSVTATASSRGAGIGGGNAASGSDITISGGVVTASSTTYGAGIGGGLNKAGTDIKISGGTVRATGVRGAGIGGGDMQYLTTIPVSSAIKITDGDVIAASTYGSGIGGGFCGGTTALSDVTVDVNWTAKAGDNAAKATKITHTGSEDIASQLVLKKYASVRFETVTVSAGSTASTTADKTYQAVSDNAFTVAANGVLNVAKGTTFSGNTGAIVNAGTVNVTGAFTLATENDTIVNNGTLNWDISAGSATNLDFSISDWAKYDKDSTGTLTVTVSATSQYGGNYALADNVAGDFAITLKGLDQDYALSLSGTSSVTVGGKYYGLSKTLGTVSLLVAKVTEAETGTVTCCAGTATRITGGTADKMFFGGTISSTGGTVAITSNGTISIAGGTFGNSIACGSASKSNTQLSQEGNLDFTIEGGTFSGRVAGGMYVADGAESTKPSTATATLDGSVKLTIKGGTFNGRIYGGCNAQKDAYGVQSTIEGSVSVTVDSSKSVIAINNYLIGGSRGATNKTAVGSGSITGDVTVTFTGLGDNLQFAKTSVVAGGCNGDYVKIDAEGKRTTITGVKGSRNLVFDKFTGDFDANLKLFSTATFKNGTKVAFNNASVNLWAIDTWNFEFGSSFSNLQANDFDKDTLNFDVTGLTTESDWTVGSGAVAAFDDLMDAAAVYFGTSAATYDEDNACWTDGTYKLALSDAKTDMIVSKIA